MYVPLNKLAEELSMTVDGLRKKLKRFGYQTLNLGYGEGGALDRYEAESFLRDLGFSSRSAREIIEKCLPGM